MPDIDKIRELQSKVMKDIAAGAIIPIIMIGDELGLFEKLYEFGPCSSKKFAKKIEMDHRYLREWLLALSWITGCQVIIKIKQTGLRN